MDNTEMSVPSLAKLKCFINSSLIIDYPLYISNAKNGIKIGFDDLNDMCAEAIAHSILERLLQQKGFWVCEYGSDSACALQEKNFLTASPVITEIIPHQCSTADTDWFEYDIEAISCNYVVKDSFSFDTYIRYVFRQDFLSNTIFLVDVEKELAIHIYDRRGIDIVSTDLKLLEQLSSDFCRHIVKSFGRE